jgi:hypothetical protein
MGVNYYYIIITCKISMALNILNIRTLCIFTIMILIFDICEMQNIESDMAYAVCNLKNSTKIDAGRILMNQKNKDDLILIKGIITNYTYFIDDNKSSTELFLQIHNGKIPDEDSCEKLGIIYNEQNNTYGRQLGELGPITIYEGKNYFVLTDGILRLFGDKSQFNIVGKSCALYDNNSTLNKKIPKLCGSIVSISKDQYDLLSNENSSRYILNQYYKYWTFSILMLIILL